MVGKCIYYTRRYAQSLNVYTLYIVYIDKETPVFFLYAYHFHLNSWFFFLYFFFFHIHNVYLLLSDNIFDQNVPRKNFCVDMISIGNRLQVVNIYSIFRFFQQLVSLRKKKKFGIIVIGKKNQKKKVIWKNKQLHT